MPVNPDGSISISTIGDFIDGGYHLSVHCHSRGPDGYVCHHSADIDLVALAEKLGRDHPAKAMELKRYFRCSVCGSKEIGFIVSPPDRHEDNR